MVQRAEGKTLGAAEPMAFEWVSVALGWPPVPFLLAAASHSKRGTIDNGKKGGKAKGLAGEERRHIVASSSMEVGRGQADQRDRLS